MIAIRTSRRAAAATGTLLMCAVALAAGCTDNGSTPPRTESDPAVTQTPSVDPSIAAAEQQARAAYAGYIETWARMLQAADPDSPELTKYVNDPLLGLTRRNVRRIKDIGAVQVGGQKATVQRVEVNLAAAQPTVTIYSCLDYRDLKLVYRSNQSPVPNSVISNPVVPSVATVWRYTNGQWLVNDTQQGSHQC